jgi:DNA polymerase elongation subunit (family B)
VNSSFPEFMRETFLCNPGFDEIIKAGRELVSDRGIFVDKKRYILHIVDKEGKASDSLKVMGLDTKKTTLPRPIANKLNGFIEEFLKGKPWDEIALEIVEYKDLLYATDDVMSIGLPKGVKNVDQYTAELNKNSNARVPGHVMASIHYNYCLKEFHDKVSMPIMSGMKIKVFYLKTTVGRFKSIALPTDLEVVPQWFLDNFEIDKDAHVERLVDNPLENIVGAIGKKAPSRQTILIDSLFEF